MIYAVAYINFYDNELTIEIVEAGDEVSAALKHSKVGDYDSENAETLEKLKEVFFNCDAAIDVKGI